MHLTHLKYVPVLLAAFCWASGAVQAQQRIRDLCRVKGQEENSLIGVGLVAGLNGTGDPNLPATLRALARILSNTGIPLPKDPDGRDLTDELEDVKNVALVFVTATVPAAGARQGDKLSCSVTAWGNAKSLEGGHLLMAPMLGGRPTDDPARQRIFAFAQGPVHLENPDYPLSGNVYDGCRLETTFHNAFSKDGVVTLVLDKNHANFRTAQDIAEVINSFPDFRYDGPNGYGQQVATALDQVNVQARIPEKYRDYPVQFVSQVLNMEVSNLQKDARVVINQQTGTVVIGDDVVIAPVAITHRNFSIEAGPFFPFDPSGNADSGGGRQVKLQSLVDALNALQASPQDIIDIIKTLKRSGDLFGELVIQ